jgi:hypothetical protein
MQWLPHDVLDALDGPIRELDEAGFSTTRAEAICALVFACDPTDSHLLESLRAYRARHRLTRPPSRERLRGVPLVLKMPSPITLRLDGLVRAIAMIDQRVYRHEVIGTMILGVGDLERLEKQCRKYRKAVAEEAAVQGQTKRSVLTQVRPRPGARL